MRGAKSMPNKRQVKTSRDFAKGFKWDLGDHKNFRKETTPILTKI